MKKNSTVTVLDIGSTKVCCCIANVIDEKNFDIIGIGYCVCHGVKSGVIVDMESVEGSITKAVENAEKMANFRIKSIYVNISGKNVKSKIVNVSIDLNGKIIKDEDLLHLFTSCEEENESREIIHSIPILYSVDSLNGVKDPIGMIANKLSANINIVTVSKVQLHNILICLARCHLDPIGIVASCYASGLCVMDEEDMVESRIVIDFGGEITSIGFFYSGIFCGSVVISLGGKNITNDIAYGLNISFSNAERLKTLHGAAFVSITDHRDLIFAPVIEDEDVVNLQQIPKSTLNQVIQSRTEEILNSVKQQINDSVFGMDFSRCVIITGGGSLMPGIRDFASGILGKKIKLKKMDDFVDGSDVQIGNNFSTVLGMVKFAQISDRNLVRTKPSTKTKEKIGFLKKTLNWIENNL
jgi:cell division protein FtsA